MARVSKVANELTQAEYVFFFELKFIYQYQAQAQLELDSSF